MVSAGLPAGHAHVPYVDRFNNWQNSALDSDGDPSNGYRFVTQDQLLSRGDFQAQILHYRLRRATGVHGLQGGVEGYTPEQFQSDINTGWNSVAAVNNILADPKARLATLDTQVEADGVLQSLENVGVVFSGVLFQCKGKLVLLLSNLDEQSHTITFASKLGGKSVPGDYPIDAGTHEILQFDALGSSWNFTGAIRSSRMMIAPAWACPSPPWPSSLLRCWLEWDAGETGTESPGRSTFSLAIHCNHSRIHASRLSAKRGFHARPPPHRPGMLFVRHFRRQFPRRRAHLLYMTTPDAAQGGGSGEGILIFDIDKGHEFVRRIDVPSFKEGVRGIDACAATGRLYVTTSAHRLICMDIKTDEVLWEKTYDTGCDRGAITPDGKVLYIPAGWWIHDQCWLVVSGETGEEIAPRIKVNGRRTTPSSASMAPAPISPAPPHSPSSIPKTTRFFRPSARSARPASFPLPSTARKRRAYVCLGNTIGFDVADLATGKVLGRILTDGEPIHRRTHGTGLTPDEKELWISDQAGNAVYVFDNTVWPLKQLAKIDVKKGGHGWVAFSVDGRFAYTASTEVIDVKSRRMAAIFKDEKGKAVCSSKFVEVQLEDGKVVRAGDQFGVGRVVEVAHK